MDLEQGTKVWQATVFSNPLMGSCPYYMNEGEVTGIVVDGVPMVRMGEMLLPLVQAGRTCQWRISKAEAKRDAWREVVRIAGRVQAAADRLQDEILHDDLTTEEAVA